jgi:hypothetical protein
MSSDLPSNYNAKIQKEVVKVRHLIIVCISLIVISLIFTGVSNAKIDPASVIGAWLFDEGNGAVAKDSSANHFDGKVVGAKWQKGKNGSCLEFSGVAGENYVDCGDQDKLNYVGDGKFSVTLWVKVLANDANYHNLVSKKMGFNNTDKGWMVWYDFRFQGAMELRINDGTTLNDDVPVAPDNTLMAKSQDGNWHHLGWVITEPGKFIYYFDGENKGEGIFAMKGSTKNSVSLRMGNSEGNSPGLNCLMDEVGIFNVTLTDADIQELMKNGIVLAVFPLSKLASTWGEVKK